MLAGRFPQITCRQRKDIYNSLLTSVFQVHSITDNHRTTERYKNNAEYYVGDYYLKKKLFEILIGNFFGIQVIGRSSYVLDRPFQYRTSLVKPLVPLFTRISKNKSFGVLLHS